MCLYWVESSLYFIQGCLNEAAVAATTLSEPIHVKGNDNKLVFLSIAYPPKVDGPAPKDPLFGIEMPVDAAVGKRKTEYCQWKELKPRKKGRQAGEERDPCVKKSESKALRLALILCPSEEGRFCVTVFVL